LHNHVGFRLIELGLGLCLLNWGFGVQLGISSSIWGVVLAVRTTTMSLQSQIVGEPETLEPPWHKLQARWTQLLQEEEDAPRDIPF